MAKFDNKISNLVNTQLPDFVVDDHPKFVEFLKTYFQFMEAAELSVTSIESTDGITVRSLGNEELEEPHIKLIFELLVMQSGEFSNFKIQDNWWAWAQKSKSGSKVLEHTSKMMTKN